MRAHTHLGGAGDPFCLQKGVSMFHQTKAPASEAKRKYFAPSPPRMIQSAQPGDRLAVRAQTPTKG